MRFSKNYSKKYSAEIVGVNFDKLKKLGTYYTIAFKLLDRKSPAKIISKFVTYQLRFGEISTHFQKLAETFSPSRSIKSFNPEDLIGKKCFVTVSTAGWPRINEISLS